MASILDSLEDEEEVVAADPNVKAADPFALDFQPATAPGELPTLTVQGSGIGEGEVESSFFGGLQTFKQEVGKAFQDPFAVPEPLGLEQTTSPEGEPVLTASGGQSNLEKIIGATALRGLTALGIPTRALGAAVTDVNPFASEEDKGKSFEEVFSDPQSGIFKEGRRIVDESDLPSAVKFIINLGISIPEDPMSLMTGLVGAFGKATGKKAATSGLKFTPAEQAFVESGGKSVPKKIAQKEITARTKVPELVTEIKQGRSEVISNKLGELREKHGLSTLDQETIQSNLEAGVESGIGRYRQEAGKLYKSINEVADPVSLTKEVKSDFESHLLKMGLGKKSLPEGDRLEFLIKALQDGKAEFVQSPGGGAPRIQMKVGAGGIPSEVPALTASEMGISSGSLKVLKDIQKSLDSDLNLGRFRTLRSTLRDKQTEAFRAGKANESRVLSDVLTKMKETIGKQMDEVAEISGNPNIKNEWMEADRFIAENADGIKIAKKLFFDSGGNQRTVPQLIKQFAKRDSRGQAIALDKMRKFFDEETIGNIQNLYFNNIIERATVKGNLSGIKMKQIINDLPEQTFESTFTKSMRDDISELVGEAVQNDIASSLNKTKLGTFSPKDKSSIIKTLFANPAYRMWSAGRGFTVMSLKLMTVGLFTRAIRNALEDVATKRAGTFLRNVPKNAGPIKLTVKSAFRDEGNVARAAAVETGRSLETPKAPQTPTFEAAGQGLLDSLEDE